MSNTASDQMEAILHELQAIRKLLERDAPHITEAVNDRKHIDKVVDAIKVTRVSGKSYIVTKNGRMELSHADQVYAYVRATYIEVHGNSVDYKILPEIVSELELKSWAEVQNNTLSNNAPNITYSNSGVGIAVSITIILLACLVATLLSGMTG